MNFLGKIINILKNPRKYMITIILGVLVIITGYMAYNKGSLKGDLVYKDNLDRVVIIVDEHEITLRDMAFYTAYEEMEVEKQAVVYNPEDTNKYWNLHVDGEFVKIAARNAVIQMAIHDVILCEMAEADGVKLEGADYQYLANTEYDFISDLEDYEGLDKLGVTQEDICATMEKVALAQKYQEIYSRMNGVPVNSYDFAGDAYKELLENNYNYKVIEKDWKRVPFGNVILEH